ERLLALGSSCVTLAGGSLTRWPGGSTLATGVGGVARSGRGLLVWNDTRAWEVDPMTGERGSGFAVDQGVTAMLRDTDTFVGFADGFIVVDRGSAGELPGAPMLADTPSAPVTTIEAGPAATIVAGFANGVVGVWSRSSRRKLYQVRLLGPVDRVLRDGNRLLAVTGLGETAPIDLSVLGRDYCSLMRDIWATTPVVWSAPGPARSSPPSSHPCLTGR